MVSTPERRVNFEHDQAIYRDAWALIQAGTHTLVGNYLRAIVHSPEVVEVVAPAPAPTPAHPMCIATKVNGEHCSKPAVDGLHGRCTMHHRVATRHAEDASMQTVLREVRNMYRRGDLAQAIDAYVDVASVTLAERCRQRIRDDVDRMILQDYYRHVSASVDAGETLEIIAARINGWIATGDLNIHRAEILMGYTNRTIIFRHWRAENLPAPAPRFGADQREAQLATDTQNVHTSEITKQMTESVALLLAVWVPIKQSTLTEIVASWRAQGRPENEIKDVYADVVRWWNKSTIYKDDDKLYKKCLRGLWATIQGYKGEMRAELEKRLWDECRDAAIPYSVCTQGHMARLSNVMVGFDDAFVPPIPVGEILQQKMAAIAGMDVDHDRQIELANEVLSELKIPVAEHENWLAAF